MKAGKGMWKNYGKGVDSLGDDEKVIGFICGKGEWNFMIKIGETVENAVKDYGKEAFLNHREEVYRVIEAACFCAEFLQNQEDWGSRRAIPVRKSCSREWWEENFSERRDYDLRREELWRLRCELAHGFAEKDIPLKNFLCQGIDLMIKDYWYDPETWTELMETQMMTDSYRDYRAFEESVYFLGLLETGKFQCGINYHFFRGDFREAEHFLKCLAHWIPEEEGDNYQEFCVQCLKDMERKRMDTIKRTLEERDRRLKNMQEEKGGIPVLELFHKKIGEMTEKEFGQFVTAQFEEYAYGESEELSQEADLQAGKITRIRKLAELFVYGDSGLKKRFFQYLSGEEQMLVMGQWMADFYPSNGEKLARRLVDMLYAVQPEGMWDRDENGMSEHEKTVYASLEKIMGRDIIEKYGML